VLESESSLGGWILCELHYLTLMCSLIATTVLYMMFVKYFLKIVLFLSQDVFKVAPNELNYALSWLLNKPDSKNF
jgi:hypothetical protein